MDLVQFRHPGDSRLIVRDDSIQPANESKEKINTRGEEVEQNVTFKKDFYRALKKAEGKEVAKAALESAGLPQDWKNGSKPLHSRQVEAVLEQAENCRRKIIESNKQKLQEFIKKNFTKVFTKNNPKNPKQAWPKEWANSSQLHALFERGVKQHPDYFRVKLTAEALIPFAVQACHIFCATKKGQFYEAFPCLSQFAESDYCEQNYFCFNEVSTAISVRLSSDESFAITNSTRLEGDTTYFRIWVKGALSIMREIQDLLPQMAYEPNGWKEIIDSLETHIERLTDLAKKIREEDNTPTTKEGQELKESLTGEITHQQKLLEAKKLFIEDIVQHDPFSAEAVAYSNLLWAHVAQYLFDDARTENPEFSNQFDEKKETITNFIQKRENEKSDPSQLNLSREDIFVDKDSHKHPVKKGKKQSIELVTTLLTDIGLSKEEVNRFTDDEAVRKALCKALNNNQDWAIHAHPIMVHKEGITRCYLSTIIPAGRVNQTFEAAYSNEPGVSSADRANLHHPRNAKVSMLERVRFDGSKTLMATFIGHGVLDMWKITDTDDRTNANKKGAEEILQLALATNARVCNKMLKGESVKLTHVSVNLTTPSGVYETPFADKVVPETPDFTERIFTVAQFKAFEDAIGQDHKISFLPENSTSSIEVPVEVITFSFATNAVATSPWSNDYIGGWANVEEHNYQQMQRFIGNLGTPPGFLSSKKSRVEGQRPGGFIGSVMDELDLAIAKAVKEQKTNREQILRWLSSRLQEQTDLVRHLFLTEAYKYGNGDPAKMSREILALQVFAEQTLNAIHSSTAATLSKGCKSDKDRGGVVDVELKYKLITEDLGGVVTPDTKLESQDQRNYMSIAISTQLRTQQYSCGLPGSKSIGNLKTRMWNPTEMQLVTGLSPLAKE